jgi:hypothetical protein
MPILGSMPPVLTSLNSQTAVGIDLAFRDQEDGMPLVPSWVAFNPGQDGWMMFSTRSWSPEE